MTDSYQPFLRRGAPLELQPFGRPAGLPLIIICIVIATITIAIVTSSLTHLIPVALAIAIGMWAARIIAGG